jgi:hypothetical protein
LFRVVDVAGLVEGLDETLGDVDLSKLLGGRVKEKRNRSLGGTRKFEVVGGSL